MFLFPKSIMFAIEMVGTRYLPIIIIKWQFKKFKATNILPTQRK